MEKGRGVCEHRERRMQQSSHARATDFSSHQEAKAEGTDMLPHDEGWMQSDEHRTIVLLLLVCRGGATRERRKARPDAQHGWLSVRLFRS